MKRREAKTSRSFATEPKLWDRAKKKAEREGTTISEKIDKWLRNYLAPTNGQSVNSEGQGADGA